MSNLIQQKQPPLDIANEINGLDMTLTRSLFGALPAIKILFDPEEAEVLSGKLADRQHRAQLSNTYLLLAEVLRNAKTVDDLKANVSAMEKLLHERFVENMCRAYQQMKDLRRTLFSLKLAYDNAPKGAIRLFPVDRNAFVDCADDLYWKAFSKKIKQLFRKWELKSNQAPCYLSWPFPLKTPDAARKVAGFAEEVVGMAMLDIRPFKKAKDVVEYMRNSFPIMGSNGQGAHLMVAGTHAYMDEVFENYGDTQRMALPLGPALLGRMLSTPIGIAPTSLNGIGLVGLNGVTVEYDEETTESAAFAKQGILQIIDNGKIQGTATACDGDIPVYNSFTLMDIFIMVQRSLVATANEYAHGSWGKNEIDAFTGQLLRYFNDLYDDTKGYRVIEEPVTKEMIGVAYNDATKTVFVSIPIKYKGVVSKFRFTLIGKDQQFDRLKKRPV